MHRPRVSVKCTRPTLELCKHSAAIHSHTEQNRTELWSTAPHTDTACTATLPVFKRNERSRFRLDSTFIDWDSSSLLSPLLLFSGVRFASVRSAPLRFGCVRKRSAPFSLRRECARLVRPTGSLSSRSASISAYGYATHRYSTLDSAHCSFQSLRVTQLLAR